MTATPDAGLLERLENLAMDDPEAAFPFSARLARENGWSREFARRAVREYKRFVYLAMTAGHPVTPSEEVDQVWHLHMVYTRSYWEDMCQGVLGQPLHHGPTRGGAAEGGKFHDWYRRTLESYAAAFDYAPPADLWPDPDARFAHAGRARWVDTTRAWVLPKPRFLRPRPDVRRGRGAPLAASTAILATGAGWHAVGGPAALPPFSWNGKTFLLFYAIAILVARFATARAIRRAAASPAPADAHPLPDVSDLYLQAMLAGGGCRVMQTAVMSLVASGSLRLEKSGALKRYTLVCGGPRPADPVEARIYDTVKRAGRVRPRAVSGRKLRADITTPLQTRLVKLGLIPAGTGLSVKTAWPLFLVLALGIARVIQAILHVQPFGFLVMLIVLTLYLISRTLTSRRRLTLTGEKVLGKLQSTPPDPRTSPLPAFALLGPAIMGAIPFAAPLAGEFLDAAAAARAKANPGNNGCGGGCSTDSGGSSGCGSSGCGSSGCGGCGGS